MVGSGEHFESELLGPPNKLLELDGGRRGMKVDAKLDFRHGPMLVLPGRRHHLVRWQRNDLPGLSTLTNIRSRSEQAMNRAPEPADAAERGLMLGWLAF